MPPPAVDSADGQGPSTAVPAKSDRKQDSSEAKRNNSDTPAEDSSVLQAGANPSLQETELGKIVQEMTSELKGFEANKDLFLARDFSKLDDLAACQNSLRGSLDAARAVVDKANALEVEITARSPEGEELAVERFQARLCADDTLNMSMCDVVGRLKKNMLAQRSKHDVKRICALYRDACPLAKMDVFGNCGARTLFSQKYNSYSGCAYGRVTGVLEITLDGSSARLANFSGAKIFLRPDDASYAATAIRSSDVHSWSGRKSLYIKTGGGDSMILRFENETITKTAAGIVELCGTNADFQEGSLCLGESSDITPKLDHLSYVYDAWREKAGTEAATTLASVDRELDEFPPILRDVILHRADPMQLRARVVGAPNVLSQKRSLLSVLGEDGRWKNGAKSNESAGVIEIEFSASEPGPDAPANLNTFLQAKFGCSWGPFSSSSTSTSTVTQRTRGARDRGWLLGQVEQLGHVVQAGWGMCCRRR